VKGDFELPSAYVHRVVASTADVDAYGHVNNSVYLRWLDETAWAHSAALGIPPSRCIALRRGMVVWRSLLYYTAPAFANDALEVGTWIVSWDGRLRVDRRFQVLRASDRRTLLRGLLRYVCADLDGGGPRRMPPEFIAHYEPHPEIAAAAACSPDDLAPDATPR
jgi:acyl-CoA thioester hydrolase